MTTQTLDATVKLGAAELACKALLGMNLPVEARESVAILASILGIDDPSEVTS